MKKSVIASILGIAAATLVTSAYGQGSIIFDNYDSTPYLPIAYTSTAANLPVAFQSQAGKNVDSASFDVELLYALGASQPIGSLTPLASTIETIDTGKSDSLSNGPGGYFDALPANIASYTSGAVTFAVEAWYTGAGSGGATYALSGFRGISSTWTESSLATGQTAASYFTFGGLGSSGTPLVTVAAVPEPTTLALAGLGGAALLALRRKKA
jgi:hypothetical protein